MKITISHNISEVARALAAAPKQVQYATAVALTKTAAKVREAIPAAMDKTFDRPTAFTRNGTYLIAARRDDLTAQVVFKDISPNTCACRQRVGHTSPRPAASACLATSSSTHSATYRVASSTV